MTDLERAQAAATELRELQAEQRGVGPRMGAAAGAGDSQGVATLSRRNDTLPHLLLGAQARHLQAQIPLVELEDQKAAVEAQGVQAEREEALARLQEAQAAFAEVDRRSGALFSRRGVPAGG